jgi:hypothetical protein
MPEEENYSEVVWTPLFLTTNNVEMVWPPPFLISDGSEAG